MGGIDSWKLPFNKCKCSLRRAPIKIHRTVHEPSKPKKNYIPPHLTSRPGYPVPPSYDFNSFPNPTGPYSRVVPQYPYQYPNLTKAPPEGPNPGEAHPQQDEALPS
eukprot:scaffold12385_cov94-Skeletonema_dohrnii-CCMP3373.AAC.1